MNKKNYFYNLPNEIQYYIFCLRLQKSLANIYHSEIIKLNEKINLGIKLTYSPKYLIMINYYSITENEVIINIFNNEVLKILKYLSNNLKNLYINKIWWRELIQELTYSKSIIEMLPLDELCFINPEWNKLDYHNRTLKYKIVNLLSKIYLDKINNLLIF